MSATSVWRFIPLLVAPGALQMAIDSWLLEGHRRGEHPPALRFYTWEPAAVSLGYHQRRWPEGWRHLKWRDRPVDLVRRPSGGRGVLHQGDLTYAVVMSGLSGPRSQVYQYLCQFLIAGWRSLGYNLHYGSAGRGYIHNPDCFATATGADLVSDGGYKLIGSAQLRRDGAILQHGSMRLNPDPELYSRVFGEKAVSPPPPPVASETIIEALADAARESFGIELETRPLSEAEWRAIAPLADQFSV